MKFSIPRLRLWHLIGLVAASAAFIQVMQFRSGVDNPTYVWIRQLRSMDASQRLAALQHLQQMESRTETRPAIEPLIEALNDTDSRVRRESAKTLKWILGGNSDDPMAGAVKAALTASLRDRDEGARNAIAIALAPLRPEPKSIVPVLIDALQDNEAYLRGWAADYLSDYVVDNSRAREAVFAALHDPDPGVRLCAVRALSGGSTSVPLALEIEKSVAPALKDQHFAVRSAAVETLCQLARVAPIDISRLLSLLNDPDVYVRRALVNAMPYRRHEQGVILAFGKAMSDSDKGVRLMAVRRLAQFGIDAEETLPALQIAKNDQDEDIHRSSVKAITAIEAHIREFRTEILPKLRADLKSDEPETRRLAAEAVGERGPKAKAAVPDLIRCLDDADPSVRRAASYALGELGEAAKEAVPNLKKRTEDTDVQVRRSAKAALSAIQGGSAPQATP